MGFDRLSSLSDGALFLGTLLLLTAGGELGFWLGRRRHASVDEHGRSQATSLKASTLAFGALLLGFTFSIAVQRFDSRRELVVAEANALGTAYLRASLLPAPAREELRRVYGEYADLRLRAFSGVLDSAARVALERESERLHRAMWRHASEASQQNPESVAAGLLVQATNDVIDLHTSRMAARQAHVPGSVVALLAVVAFISITWVGFSHGLGAERRSRGALVLVLLWTTGIALVVDLDRSSRGAIQVSQEPMRALRDAVRAGSPERDP